MVSLWPLLPSLLLLTAPTGMFSPWASKTSCSPPSPWSPLGAPPTPAGWSSQGCHWASSHTALSLWVALSWASSSRPKVEMPPGHLSLCVPHTSSSGPKSASLTQSSASAGCLTIYPVTRTSTKITLTPHSCATGQARRLPQDSVTPVLRPCPLPGFLIMATSSHTNLALCSHTSTPAW